MTAHTYVYTVVYVTIQQRTACANVSMTRDVVDHWENSTLVAYIPPFSGEGRCVFVH